MSVRSLLSFVSYSFYSFINNLRVLRYVVYISVCNVKQFHYVGMHVLRSSYLLQLITPICIAVDATSK